MMEGLWSNTNSCLSVREADKKAGWRFFSPAEGMHSDNAIHSLTSG